MRGAYRSVLCRRDVLVALVPYLLARLPLSMSSLALLLFVRAQTGSYHRAGLACAAYGVAVAVASPLLGRLVDRSGQSRVLLWCGVLHPAAMVGLAFAADSGVYPAVIVAAFLAGSCLPPVSACMRVLWTRLLDESTHQAGFAVEGLVVEVAELTGPLLVSAALLVGRPRTAVIAAGVMTGIGTLLFRLSGASRAAPMQTATGRWWGALVHTGVRRILLVVLTSTVTIGALEVALAAFARDHGGVSSTGLYIALISAGGIVGGLLFGRTERMPAARRTLVLGATLLASAAAAASLAQPAPAVVVLTMLFLFGAVVAIGVVVQLAVMAEVAPDEVRTEAFTWGGTANFVGLAAGTLMSGLVVDRFGVSAAFLAAGCPAVLAAFVAAVSHRSFVAAGVGGSGALSAAVAAAGQREADLRSEVDALTARVADLEAALESALLRTPEEAALDDARARARRMLDRADAACLEMRERAEDDAARVRGAATTASIEILAAAERDARSLLDRARREADGILARARRTAKQPTPNPDGRPALMAIPGLADAVPEQLRETR